PFSLTTLFGFLIAARDRVKGAGLFFGLLLLYPLPFYLAFPQARNRYVIEPIMLALSVYFLIAVWHRLFAKRGQLDAHGTPTGLEEHLATRA
ncbi:MAG: hypothetical protein WCE61_05665, partial [Candidatus Acidiferrum sp.]